jgi:L-amino acid N-acyltransferase YncA
VIRRARAAPADVEGITAVVRDVWEQDILIDVCRAQIRDDACELWVASEGRDVLGFVSAFLTTDKAGHRRWEVDLIAVRRASQGRGLGQRLIQRVCQDAERHGADLARAAIRVDNVPSQKAFERAGFSTNGERHQLFLWSPQAGHISDLGQVAVSLLPVDTLIYRGLWIEGLENVSPSEQRAIVRTARALVTRDGRANTGALIPAEGEYRLAASLRDQAKVQGPYYWFVKPISKR